MRLATSLLQMLGTATAGSAVYAVPLSAAALATGVGFIYFLFCKLGLALLQQPEGVAVFWPASGLAAGALWLSNPTQRIAVTAGIVAGTIAANLMGDRNVPLAIAFGLCNALEAHIFVRLLNFRSADAFRFKSLASALRFFTSAIVATGVTAAIATLAILAIRPPESAWFDILEVWWISDALGLILFAPPLMTAVESRGKWPGHGEALETLSLFAALIAATAYTYISAPDLASNHMPIPFATIFPLLLWIASRSRPVLLAICISTVAITIVWAMSQGLGYFGNASLPFDHRALAARITLLSIAFCGLSLLAIFTERRDIEERLRLNERRFHELAAAAPGVIFTYRLTPGGLRTMPYASPETEVLLGMRPSALQTDARPVLQQVHPEDQKRIWASFVESRLKLSAWNQEFRFVRPDGDIIWLEGHCRPVQEADGTLLWHGFLVDVTSRKQDEARIKYLLGELDHRVNNLLGVVQAVASFTASTSDPKTFAKHFQQRIASLSASHQLLVQNAWTGVQLDELVRSQLAHFKDQFETRIKIAGPALRINSKAAQVIGMALHELATNASKYGALSGPLGGIEITWHITPDFQFTWAETTNAAVSTAKRRGFGHTVLVDMAKDQLQAHVELQLEDRTVRWVLKSPLSVVDDTTNTIPKNTSRPALSDRGRRDNNYI